MGAVVLEWGQYGYFDSFDVIRSGSSMVGITEANLPSPIATNLKNGYYVDNTATLGVTYFYMIRTWRAGVSHLSDQIEILTKEPEIPISDIILDVIKTKGGYYFNPNYMQTMFQDIAGELPAEIGKPVGKILNIFKGEGSPTHAYATSNSKRPILRELNGEKFLEFSGSQSLVIPSVIMGTNKASFFYRAKSQEGVYILLESSDNMNYNTGSFYETFDTDSGVGGYGFKVTSKSRGDGSQSANQIAHKFISGGQLNTYISTHSIPDSKSTVRVNGVNGQDATGYKGNGVFNNYNHYVGSRGDSSLFFQGNLGAFGCFLDVFTSPQIQSIESLLMP